MPPHARAVPGVLDIMTHLNRPLVAKNQGLNITSVVPLDGPDIHHDGQIIGLVTAETYEAAREAAHRIVVRYDAQTPSGVYSTLPASSEDGTAEATKGSFMPKEDPHLGDAAAALARAPLTIDAHYATPTQHHNSMELFSTTASWNGDELTIDEPSQFVHGLRAGVANQLGIAPEKVHVRSEYLGGAFGGKAALTHRTVLVALAARKLGRPVKLVATRDAGFTISGNRQETRHHVRMGAGRDGRITALHHDLWELTSRTDRLLQRRCRIGRSHVRLPRRPEHRPT